MPIIPLVCPFCTGNISVDSDKDAAICEHCGRPFVVRDAIVHNYIGNVTNINATEVNVYSEKDFVIRGGVLEKYNGESVDVVIPDNVVEIGDGAFESLRVKSVVIPDGVTTIGNRAFFGCANLKSIVIPEGVTTIGGMAFHACDNLKEVYLPKSIEEIASTAFGCYGCKSLTDIHIADVSAWCNVRQGADSFNYLFYYAERLYINQKQVTELKIPEGVKKISSCAFSCCKFLTKVDLPASLTRIDSFAFRNCVGLTEITIPNNVKAIDIGAFMCCNNLAKVAIMNPNINIPKYYIPEHKYPIFFECKQLSNVDFRGDIHIFFGTPYYYMQNKRCRHCGGEFTFWTRECKKCGKNKDY